MKKIIIVSALLMAALNIQAQTTLPKVYNEEINPNKQINNALQKANGEDKFVVCQVGGNWCPWCLRFADFITNDSIISKVIEDNFIYIHVNFNPRQTSGEMNAQQAAMMKRLGNPGRFGYPVFVILDGEGRVVHIQDSSFLEEGKGYNREKVLRFFRSWTPAAVRGKEF